MKSTSQIPGFSLRASTVYKDGNTRFGRFTGLDNVFSKLVYVLEPHNMTLFRNRVIAVIIS